MAGIADRIAVGAKQGDLAAVATALADYARLAEHWRGLALSLRQMEVTAPLDSPVRLAHYVAAHLGDTEVAEVFEAAGLADLHARLGEISGKLLDPSAPWGKLVQPCSAFAETYTPSAPATSRIAEDGDNPGMVALEIPALDGDAAAQAGPAGLTFALGAGAGLEAEAGAVWPFRSDAVAPGLLRIGAQGQFDGSAGATVPFASIGRGGAHVRASGDAALGFYFRPQGTDTPFAEALVSAIVSLPSPLDLSDLSHAMALAQFEGMVLSCVGSAEAGIDVVLGDAFAFRDLASGTLGIDAGLTFRREAHWLLSLRRDGNAMRFVLSREQERERDWSVGLGLELDASGLARQVHDILAKADGLAGEALANLRPFLSPGTYLADHAAELLDPVLGSIADHPALAEALLKDADLALGRTASDRSAIVDWLGEALVAAASARANGVLADAAAWANDIASGLARKVPALAAPGLNADLAARVAPALADLKARFANTLDGLIQSTHLSQALAKELAQAGIALDASNDQAAALRAGVEALFARFHAFAGEVIAKTGEGAEQKVRARFGWTGTDSRSTQYEIMGVFSEANEETGRLWRALATGQLQPFQRILADPALAPNGVTLDPSSSLARLAGTRRGFALEIVAFGAEVSIASIVEGKAAITLSAAGDVTVSAEGRAERDVTGPDEARSASFVTTWDLFQSKLSGAGPRRAMTMSLALDHADDDLSVDEVKGLLAGLGSAGLVDGSRATRAEAIYQGWRATVPPGKKVRGRIAVRMKVTNAAIERMVMLGRGLGTAGSHERLALFTAAARAQLAAGVTGDDDLARDLKEARREFGELKDVDDPWIAMFALRATDLTPPSGGAHQAHRYRAFGQLIPRSLGFVRMVELVAQIYDALPVGGTPVTAAWTERDFARAERELAGETRRWLRLNQKWVFWFKTKMHPAAHAFMRLLAALERPALPGEAISADALDTARTDASIAITMTSADGTATAV